jgi:hypothetical protein
MIPKKFYFSSSNNIENHLRNSHSNQQRHSGIISKNNKIINSNVDIKNNNKNRQSNEWNSTINIYKFQKSEFEIKKIFQSLSALTESTLEINKDLCNNNNNNNNNYYNCLTTSSIKSPEKSLNITSTEKLNLTLIGLKTENNLQMVTLYYFIIIKVVIYKIIFKYLRFLY